MNQNEKKKVKKIMSSYDLVISLIRKSKKNNFIQINFISEKSWEGLQDIIIQYCNIKNINKQILK